MNISCRRALFFIFCVSVLLFSLAKNAKAVVVGPYASDPNTVFLFHLDEAAGANTAVNSALLTTGTNAITFKQNAAIATECPTDSTILGTPGATGFSFGNFGNAAVITNGNGIGGAGTVSNGLGVDFNLSGAFSYKSGGVGDFSTNHFIMFGPNNSFTIEALINLSTTNFVSTVGREIVCSDNNDTARGFQFRVSGARLEFNFISGAPNADIVAPIPSSGPHAFVPNAWYHVAVVHSDSPISTVLYWTRLDDAFTNANAIFTNNTGVVNIAAPLPIVIGNEGRLTGGSTEGLNGLIDEVRISKVAKSAGQMMFVDTNDAAVAILQQPINVGLDYGLNGSLSVSAASGLPIRYQWRLNGVPISGATSLLYNIANATSANAGNYDCVLTNISGNSATSGVAVVSIGAPSFLAHRYSFTTNANDSLNPSGIWDGVTNGAASFNGTGQLVLNGTSGTYVSLPSFIITNTGAVTVEAWASFGTIAANSMLFAFGNTNGNTGTNYMFCTPKGANARVSITPISASGEQTAPAGSPLDNRNVHIVAVYDPNAAYEALYTNGVLAAINSNVTVQISAVVNSNSFIGKSLYAADPFLTATIDELRIYNGALSASTIQQSFLQGPTNALSDGPVQIVSSPTNISTAQGQSVTFSGIAIGHLPISYQWQKNGINIPGANNSTLSFAASFGDTGTIYRLLATNVVGATTFTATSSVASLTVSLPETLAWVGASSPNWDISTPNWTNGITFVNFAQFDGALLDARGLGQPNVNVATTINTTSLTVSNSTADYLLTSSGQVGSLIGQSSLSKRGTAKLTLNVANSMVGSTFIENGTLQVGNGDAFGALPAGPMTNNGALVFNLITNLTFANPISGSGSISDGGTAGIVTLAAPVSGLTVTKNGNGTLVLGSTNTYTGKTIINGGTLQLTGSGTFGTGEVTNNSAILFSGTTVITNTISGPGNLTNDVTGTVTLSGVNSYSGATVVNGPNFGGLVVGNSGALGNTPQVTVMSTAGGALGGTRITLNAGVSTPSSIPLVLPTVGTTIRSCLLSAGASSWNGPITLNGDGAASPGDQLAFAGSGGLLTIGGNVTGSSFDGGTLQLRGDGTGSGSASNIVNGAGGVINGTLSLGGGTLQVNDGAVWTINSSGNTWGNSQIAKGTLRIGVNDALPTTTTVRFSETPGNATLDLNGFNQTVAALSTFNGTTTVATITNGSTTADSIFTFAGTFSTYGGNIADGARKLTLVVNSGALILTNFTTFFGDTVVNSTLGLSGYGSLSNSANINLSSSGIIDTSVKTDNTLTINPGQTLRGSGTVNGNAVDNGSIAPGPSIATLTINNNLTLAGNMFMKVDKSGSPTSDSVTVLGTIANIGSGVVTISNQGPALIVGDSFQLFNQAVPGGNTMTISGAGVVWNNHLAVDGTISVASLVVQHPLVTKVSQSGSNLIFSGNNGPINSPYYVLTATNILTSLGSWVPLLTNSFDGNGNFSVTNAITPGSSQRFYILRLP